MAIDTEPLEPGAVLYAFDGRTTHAVKLSALLRPIGTHDVLGLVGRGIMSAPVGARVMVGRSEVGRSIGRIEPVRGVFPEAGGLDSLFQVIRFDEDVAVSLRGAVIDVAISKDIAQNVLGSGPLRVRKLNAPTLEPRRDKNYVPVVRNSKGFLTGNVMHPIIERHEGTVTLPRASVARGRGRQEFAKPGDSGAPVLSASGALLGFVVGRDAKRTLVLSAEDVMSRLASDFVVRKERTGPANRARIRRRRPTTGPLVTAAE